MAVKEIVLDKGYEELGKYFKDNVLEVVFRDKKKKYKEFVKFVVNEKPETKSKELLENAVTKLNKISGLSEKNYKSIKNLTKLQSFNLIISGLNLCATCAGFAVMSEKLNAMSGQINKFAHENRQMNDTRTNRELENVVANHRNMLDGRKTHKYYTTDQMRKLVDDEYSILKMLIELLMKDLSADNENLIFSIFSMANMLTVSLCIFDELYYFENKDIVGEESVWHSSHDIWMSVFDELSSDEFMSRIQDYAIFELGLSTFDTDYYYLGLLDQIKELSTTIRDKQEILVTLDNEKLIEIYNDFINKIVSSEIKEAFEQTEGAMDDPEVVKVYQDGVKQMALAV